MKKLHKLQHVCSWACKTKAAAVQVSGFIAVREMSGRNKISQDQGIVREFYQLSGKFWHWEKLMKNVMEFHRMSGKMTILDDATLQSPHISIIKRNRDLEIFSNQISTFSNSLIMVLRLFCWRLFCWHHHFRQGALIFRYAFRTCPSHFCYYVLSGKY